MLSFRVVVYNAATRAKVWPAKRTFSKEPRIELLDRCPTDLLIIACRLRRGYNSARFFSYFRSERKGRVGYTMSRITQEHILSLSVPERIQLVEDIWDSIAEVPESVELSDEKKAELDRRVEAYHRIPDEGSPWAPVRERLRDRG